MSVDDAERVNSVKAIQQCLTYLSAEAKTMGLPELSILIEAAALAAGDAGMTIAWDHDCRRQFPTLAEGSSLVS